MGHIENFFAFMSCLIEQMGHKKEVLHHMSQSQRKGGHKRDVLCHMSQSQREEGHKKKVLRHMFQSQREEGHKNGALNYMSQSQREEGHNTICPHKRGEGNFKMKYIPLIIVLLLILAILVLVFYGVSRVKRFSRQLFGTDDIIQGVKKAQEDAASTPRSVSAMTRIALPQIVSDFPDFQYDEMKQRAENALTQYLQALTAQDVEILQEGNGDLKEQLRSQISSAVSQGKCEHFTQVKIHQTEIARYRKEAGRCIVTFQSAVESFHYVTDEANVVVRGSDHTLEQSRYNTDLVYIQNRALAKDAADNAIGITCPNCGAPVTNLGAKFCEYCGAGIIELNVHAWSFENIEEA